MTLLYKKLLLMTFGTTLVACAEHSCQTRLRLSFFTCQIASDCGLRTPTLEKCSKVVWTQNCPPGGFFTRHSLLKATALPTDECFWKRGFMLIHFMTKSTLNLYNRPRPYKQIHTTPTHVHTRSLTPQPFMSTNFEGHCFSYNTCTPWYPGGEARN